MWRRFPLVVGCRPMRPCPIGRSYCVSLIPPTDPIGSTPPMMREDDRVGVILNTIDLASFPLAQIRNFCIIAHVDHGKTTLSDAILRRTGVIKDTGDVACYLDKLEVEKARGITIKAQTCTFFIKPSADTPVMMMNLIDCPGHVDFSYEVARSIAVCEGAVLLVDATQGIQAQTMANLHMATERRIAIVPALSKLDGVAMPHDVDAVLGEMEDAIGCFSSEVVLTAARELKGIETLLRDVIKTVPAPVGDASAPFRGLVFDAWPDPLSQSMRCLVRVKDGNVKAKDKLIFLNGRQTIEVKEVGIMYPEPTRTALLQVGQVGYVTFFHDPYGKMSKIEIGDTISSSDGVEPIASFKPMRPVVFAGLYPDQGADSESLRVAIDKLVANDPSVTVTKAKCGALGSGYQIGVLGLLHLKIFQERLEAEYNQTVLITPSAVSYKYRAKDGTEHALSPTSWATATSVDKYLQPYVNATTLCLQTQYKDVNATMMEHQGLQVDFKNLRGNRVGLIYRIPLVSLARGLFDKLKRRTSGYATLEYDEPTYEECDIVKVDIYVNKVAIDALSLLCGRNEAQDVGRRVVVALKAEISRSVLDIPITANIGSKIIARETVAGIKKDVTHKCHAGDPTRKMKLLDNQAKSRKKAASRTVAGVELNQDALMAAMNALS